MSGISRANVDGIPVYVSDIGAIGVRLDTDSVKTNIVPVDDERVSLLHDLVVNDYKFPGSTVVQTGLSAEAVVTLLPDCVVSDGPQAKAIRWQNVLAMMLRDCQLQKMALDDANADIATLTTQLGALDLGKVLSMPFVVTGITLGTFSQIATFVLPAGKHLSVAKVIGSVTLGSTGTCRLIAGATVLASGSISGASDAVLDLSVLDTNNSVSDRVVSVEVKRDTGLGSIIVKSLYAEI